MNLKAFINNISFPKTFEQLEKVNWSNETNLQTILKCKTSNWTVPPWAKKGDIVFFMHARTADVHMKKILKNLTQKQMKYQPILEKSLELHKKYGGKIFAVGIMKENSNYYGKTKDVHYGGAVFGNIYKIFKLKNLIDIKDLPVGLEINRVGGITSVAGQQYQDLKKIIMKDNTVPEWFEKTNSLDFDGKKINKNNFLKIIAKHEVRFENEADFRSYYADYLLKHYITDDFFKSECHCYKKNIKTGTVDNIIKINGVYIFVEIKLNKENEKDFLTQLKKYSKVDYFKPSRSDEKILIESYTNKILIIDQCGIYLFDEKDLKLKNFRCEEIEKIENLKDLKSIELLKKKLIKKLF